MTYTALMILASVFLVSYCDFTNGLPDWARLIYSIVCIICYAAASNIADKREKKLDELEKRIKELEEK